MTKEKSISIAIAVFVAVLVLMMSTGTASAKIVKKSIECSPGKYQVTFDTKTGAITKGKVIPRKSEKGLTRSQLEEKYRNKQSIVIPSKIAGVKVKKIGYKAFFEDDTLKSVKFPKTLEYIGGSAFVAATVEIQSLPPNIKKIGSWAFSHASVKGGTLTIPNSLKNINPKSFANMDVKNFRVKSSNKKYTAVKGVVFTKDKTELVLYPYGSKRTEYHIPEGVKSFPDAHVFDNYKLKLYIPKSLTKISAEALIGNWVRYYVVSKDNKYFSSKEGVLYNKKKTALIHVPRGWEEYFEFTVPESVTTIKNPGICVYAEQHLRVNVPKTVTKIEKSAISFDDFYSEYSEVFCNKGTAISKYINKLKYNDAFTCVNTLDAPQLSAVTADGMNVKLAWSKASYVDKYQIYRYSEVKGKYIKVKTTEDTRAEIVMKNRGTYKFKVRGYHKIGKKEKLYSPYSKVMTVTVE